MDFLKYFITEDIYIIPEKNHTDRRKPESTAEQGVSYKLTVISDVPTPEEEKLLQGILGAIKISKDSIQHIAGTQEATGENMLVFGDYPEFSSYKPYEPVRHNNSLIVVSHNLSDLLSDVEKKRKLWESLKQMFGV